MAHAPTPPSPTERFLAPLAQLAANTPELEAHVLWHRDKEWSDGTGEVLEAEEIAFYAEGLLIEGFGAAWQILSSATGDAHVRLLFWQDGEPDLPPLPAGWQLRSQDRHPAT